MSRFPEWLKRKTPQIGTSLKISNLLKSYSIHTVCQSALCPNLMECFSKGTVAFLVLGNICTRACRFCAITEGKPPPVDASEPELIAQISQKLALNHIVITSVTRDDLPDGGSAQFARTIRAIRQVQPEVIVEVLTPDFQGNEQSLKQVLDFRPDIFNHNLETVPRLYPQVRPPVLLEAKQRNVIRETKSPDQAPLTTPLTGQADYHRSLNLLKIVKEMCPEIITKSGIMVGLGEEPDEIIKVLEDLRTVGCDMLTIGQYLRSSKRKKCMDVVRFIPPEEFEHYKDMAHQLGFRAVASGPFVRSSYGAADLFVKAGHNKSQTACKI